jgi:hypothetical protein
MTLGRMINFFIPDQKLRGISARRFGMIFVCLDIFAFFVQMVGAAFTTGENTKKDVVLLGIHIYMGGIGLQELFIIGFTVLTIQLHLTMIGMERMGYRSEKMTNSPFPWRWLFYTIYFALAMITVSYMHVSIDFFRKADYSKRSVLSSAWLNTPRATRPQTLFCFTRYMNMSLMLHRCCWLSLL